jgi:hypothetical protein
MQNERKMHANERKMKGHECTLELKRKENEWKLTQMKGTRKENERK